MKYTGENLNEILFPLGGIGSGSISIAGNGVLRDWEIFNRPNKGSYNKYTHFAIRLKDKNGKIYTRVIESDVTKDLTGTYMQKMFQGYGYGPVTMCGFPHFKNVEFTGEFPIARLEFSDDNFPGKVVLTAWNPFIPLDDKNSSIPGAFFNIEYVNTTDSDMEVFVCFMLDSVFDSAYNSIGKTEKYTYATIKSTEYEGNIKYGDMTVICEGENTEVQQSSYRGGWQDKIVTYWNELTSGEPLKNRVYDTPGADAVIMGNNMTVKAGEKENSKFVMTWNIPNCKNFWSTKKFDTIWKNYYATIFEDSKASAVYSMKNYDEFYKKTLNYKNAMFETTLPDYVIDAAASTVSVIKSATVLRLENGEFYGFEGCHEQEGSCEGTCQHVWNYAYALCFLFPNLERSIRDLEFKYTTYDDGAMNFRLPLPLGRIRLRDEWLPCLDGQMGAVIKTYREWKISGDDEWLKGHWENVKKVLEYAWSEKNPYKWDEFKTGVADGRMHHTLDMELFGASSWLQGFYLAALKAAAEMAEYLGEKDKAEEYKAVFESGYKWTNENLFNGKYFIQKIDLNNKKLVERFGCEERYWNDETNEIKYQIGEGSEIDQMCGQWHANILSLGRMFDNEKIKTACENLYKNNFKETMRDFVNPWRKFSLNDEAGAVICDYPEGVYKPKIPVPYCEETMHGFEYQMAGLLISEGFVDEGLRVAKSVRDRYNGKNRNPWNEIECGSNYARSMASFALIPIMSGFMFDMPHNKIGFNPVINKDNFKSVWSVDSGWGVYLRKNKTTEIKIKDGKIELSELVLPYIKNVYEVLLDGRSVPFKVDNATVKFEKTVIKENITVNEK